jgi:hypothetical protein
VTPEERWALVDVVFEDGRECDTCRHKVVIREYHGEPHMPPERLRECGLMYDTISRAAEPEECPGFDNASTAHDAALGEALWAWVMEEQG